MKKGTHKNSGELKREFSRNSLRLIKEEMGKFSEKIN
jgi:hypothetical protein